MRDELDDHTEDYRSLTYADWCDLLSIIKVKYERKRAAVHTKKIASAREASLSDSNKYVRILRRRKAKTGFLRSNKSQEGHMKGTMTYIITCAWAFLTSCKSQSNNMCHGAFHVPFLGIC